MLVALAAVIDVGAGDSKAPGSSVFPSCGCKHRVHFCLWFTSSIILQLPGGACVMLSALIKTGLSLMVLCTYGSACANP